MPLKVKFRQELLKLLQAEKEENEREDKETERFVKTCFSNCHENSVSFLNMNVFLLFNIVHGCPK